MRQTQRKMPHSEIDQAIKTLLETPELSKKIDRRLKYELANQEKRTISEAKKLLALYNAGMITITNGNQ